MAKIGVRKKIKNVKINEPDVLELLMKHINGEKTDDVLLKLSYEFYGVIDQYFKLGYNGKTIVFEVVENPDDGYRSCFECLNYINLSNLKFSKEPLAIVNIQEVNSDRNTWNLISVSTKHKWLEFGTNNEDDYYPSFMFEYTPDKPEEFDLDTRKGYINRVRNSLESMKATIDAGIMELDALERNYSRSSAKNLAEFFRDNGFENFACEVEEVIEIAESE